MIFEILDDRGCVIGNFVKSLAAQRKAIAEDAGGQAPARAPAGTQDIEGEKGDIHQPGPQRGVMVRNAIAALNCGRAGIETLKNFAEEIRRHQRIGVNHEEGIEALGLQSIERGPQRVAFAPALEIVPDQYASPSFRGALGSVIGTIIGNYQDLDLARQQRRCRDTGYTSSDQKRFIVGRNHHRQPAFTGIAGGMPLLPEKRTTRHQKQFERSRQRREAHHTFGDKRDVR
jgi:hypothetical protein